LAGIRFRCAITEFRGHDDAGAYGILVDLGNPGGHSAAWPSDKVRDDAGVEQVAKRHALHDVSACRATTGPAKEDLVLGAAEGQANFLRAASIGSSDLETGGEVLFDQAAIRLGLQRRELWP